MNFVRKNNYGMFAGRFVLHIPEAGKIVDLGESIEVFVRRCIACKFSHSMYMVEITKTDMYECKDRQVNRLSLVVLIVPHQNSNRFADRRIASHVLRGDGLGMAHRLGLKKWEVGSKTGYTMTIDGLLWDGQIIHVKDVAA